MSAVAAMGNAIPSSSPPLSEGSPQRTANALSAATTPNNIQRKIDRSKVDPQTLRAAEGMEAMFLDYMMKVMRQTIPKSDMDLESPATEIYRSMLDTETAEKAARTGGIGLADQIVAYLEAQRYTGKTGESASSVNREGSRDDRHTGGAHEN